MNKWMIKGILSVGVMLLLGGCLHHENNGGVDVPSEVSGRDSSMAYDRQSKAIGLIVAMSAGAVPPSDEQLHRLLSLPAISEVELEYLRPMANDMYLYEATGLSGEVQLKALMDAIADIPAVRYVEQDKQLGHR